MSSDQVKNLEASIKDRLLQESKKRNEDYQFILSRYANERFLYRLHKSKHRDHFILKGAMLFMAWTNQRYRPTRDVDLLGFGDNSVEALRTKFQDICNVEVEPDGLAFDDANVRIIEIREEQNYHGQRILLTASIGNAKIPMQFDVGFGDIVIPNPTEIDFPTLLDLPAPKIRTYPKESVVSEKLQIIVEFGIANSRMKDFYDLYVIAKQFDFQGTLLVKAIRNTFERRNTEIPKDKPVGLSEDFVTDKNKQKQWEAFINRNNVHDLAKNLSDVIDFLSQFLLPPLEVAQHAPRKWKHVWKRGGPWKNVL